MKYVGVTPQGSEVGLPAPVQVHLNQTEEAPADDFSGVFPFDKAFANLTGIRIYAPNGELCFDGITDEQRNTCAEKMLSTIHARSRAAILLDNEAAPREYESASLSVIFQNHIQPYGFSEYRGNQAGFSGQLTISKGMSEWQAAALFCKRFLHVTPRITNGAFDASGTRPAGELRFDKRGGIGYSSLVQETKYSQMISEILVPNGPACGQYAILRDKEALAAGIRRRRFFSLGQNAPAQFCKARKKAYDVKLVCPGAVPAQLLMAAKVRDSALGTWEGLYVSEIDYTLDSGGEFTRFTLRRMEECGWHSA